MKPQLIELFGIEKLTESTRNTAQKAFDTLLLETGNPDESPYMREFLGSIGVHRLPDNVQEDIREKTAVIVELERKGKKISAKDFKWNNYSKDPEPINEIKKSDFHWHTYRQAKTRGSAEKIRKDQFRWSQKGAYGSAGGKIMSQIVVNHENEKPVKIKNEPRRNFEGKRLFIHRIEYDTNPGDFFKSQRRKANILAETFEEARQMLHVSMNGEDYNITNSSDSELEIHAISPALMKEIWKEWNRKFDPDSKRLRG